MAATADATNAQGAQVALESFNIPDFPPEARTLKALTLTSAITADAYRLALTKPFTVPTSLPLGLESITLELFSLGYPTGFLTSLASRIPNLKSVVVYSQLFSGLTKESQEDAVLFFKHLPQLRGLHLLDVFAKPSFFESASTWLKYNTSDTPGEARRGLMFLEINYTFDHTDQDYMSKIAATELPSLVGPGLISCSFNISPPEPEDDRAANTASQGIMAFNKQTAQRLVTSLTAEDTYPRGLRALNTTLYTITVADLKSILVRNKNIMMLSVTVETDVEASFKQELLRAFENCQYLEQIEVVAHPTIDFFMRLTQSQDGALAKSFPSLEDLQALSEKLTKLKSFKVDILRSSQFGKIEYVREDERWMVRS